MLFMERARLAEILLAGFLICFSTYFLLSLVSISGFRVVLNLSIFLLLLVSGVLLVIDIFEERVLLTRIYVWFRRTVFRLRAKYSVSPYVPGLGPLRIRVNDPVSLIVSMVFVVDTVAGLMVFSRSIFLGLVSSYGE